MEKELKKEEKQSILDRAAQIKKEQKRKGRVLPIAVFGREDDEKELYVAYFGEPSMANMSKFLTLSKTNEVKAMQQLAKDMFIEGDRDLVDDESLFMLGAMQVVGKIIESRQALVVGL